MRLSNLTDLPLVQGVWFNRTGVEYDFNVISQYASGVKAEIGSLLWYQTTDGDYSPTGYSEFVTQMHNRQMAVHVF